MPCVNMHASGNVYNLGGDQFVEEGRNIKERRRKKKRNKMEGKNERKRERKREKRKSAFRWSEVNISTVGTCRTKK